MMKKYYCFILICHLALYNTAYGVQFDELHTQALQQYKAENYNTALSLWQKSISLKPNPAAYYGIGLCYMHLNFMDDAYEALKNAAMMDRSYVKGLHELSSVYESPYSDYFNPDKAIAILETANRIDPYHASSQLSLGRLYFLKGTAGIGTTHEKMMQYQNLTEKTLLKALELNQKMAEAYHLLGRIYGNWGQHNSSVRQFQKAVQIQPRYYEAWLYLGWDYMKLGMTEDAANACRNAQQSNDKNDNRATRCLDQLQQMQNQ